MFVLKRLSDALAENDRVLGVIKDVVVNQSGNAHSITHPHSDTQVSLFRRILQRNDIDPTSISVIEAHGTGTQVFGSAFLIKYPCFQGRRAGLHHIKACLHFRTQWGSLS